MKKINKFAFNNDGVQIKNRSVIAICLFAVAFLISFNLPSFAQSIPNKAVSGIVVDENSDPIIGAAVTEKDNPNNGTLTDLKGKFTIMCKHKNEIVISYIGYVKQTINVKGQDKIRVILKSASVDLDEVVVVGYGTRKKATLSGAVGTLEGKELQSKPFPNVSQALQGQIPGLVVNRTGSAPGRGGSLQVRGISSLNGGSPLVLIDGVEGDINALNPSDIDNISVLKDASASIYGSRASDGVILITTRSGKKGTPTISFNSYLAIKHPAALRETVSLYQYAMMARDAASDGSILPGAQGYEFYSDDDIAKILANSDEVVENGVWGRDPKLFRNQDWYKLTIKDGNLQNYNVDISGGTDKVTYLISGAFQNENGIVKFGKDNFKRYNLRSKIDVNLLSNLKVSCNLDYDSSRQLASVNDYYFICLTQMRCWAPLYNSKGHFCRYDTYPQAAQMEDEGGLTRSRMTRWSGNFKAEYQIIKGLKFVGQAAIITTQNFAKAIARAYDMYDYYDNLSLSKEAWINQNAASNSYSRSNYGNFSGILDFNRVFGLHTISAMAGVSQEQSTYDGFWGSRYNFTNNELFELDLGDSGSQYCGGNGSDWAIRSYFGRLGYIFNNRYIIDASFRYDGSSRFHPDHRWGFFPGVSAAWYISEEKFIKDLNIFDNLKLRASYGKVGNQSGIGLYDYFETIVSPTGAGYYPFGVNGSMSVGARSGGMVSLARTWESIYTTNLGIDIGLLNNRLSFSADLFYKKNKNMLVSVSYPSVLGASAPYTNNGTLRVKGFEMTLAWRDKIGKDFQYGVRLSLSDATNKIVHLNGVSTYGEGLNGAVEGYSTNSYFGYKSDGYIQTTEDRDNYVKMGGVYSNLRLGDMKYKDIDGDGKLTPYGDGKDYKGDLTYLGNRNPRYNFGLNIDMNWKGFDLTAFVQGTLKRSLVLTDQSSIPFYYPWYDPPRYFYGKTWTEDNPNSKYPRLTFNNNIISWNNRVSSHRIINAAYARLKNLQFGYTLPQSLTSRVNIKKLRVYFSGTDLFEIDHMPKCYDPEDPNNTWQYPFTRFYSIGFNLTL
jgi:TonB-linked SusC/RagA family outer membrane protein